MTESVQSFPQQLRCLSLLALSALFASCGSTPQDEPELAVGAQVAAQERSGKWLCTATALQSWNCRQHEGSTGGNTTIGGKGPSGSTTRSASPAPQPVAPAKVAAPARSPIEAQIAAAPPGAVIVQLIAARDQAVLEKYKAKQPALPYEQVAIERDGEVWQILFLGPYKTQQQAQEIVEALAPFPEPTWIRPVNNFRPWLLE